MPFDSLSVMAQLTAQTGTWTELVRSQEDAVRMARTLYSTTPHDVWCAQVGAALAAPQTRQWLAQPHTPLHTFAAHDPLDAGYSVLAVDGSEIAPERHRGSRSYLVNIGRVFIRYGAEPYAALDSISTHYLALTSDHSEEVGWGRQVQATRTLREIEELAQIAAQEHPDMALLDGSIFPLALALRRDADGIRWRAAYQRFLDMFGELEIPIVAYISKPESRMVVTALRHLAAPGSPLSMLDDATLFWHLLAPGERSPVFRAQSIPGLSAQDTPWAQIGFCYLATRYEIAKLEFPLWVADAGHLDHVQRVLLRQCELGNGYPNVLTLAHQQAVLTAQDREAYFYLLEQVGMLTPLSEKARGKRAVGASM